MCCQKAKWKREIVNDHKFDFVCVEDFKVHDTFIGIRYLILYLTVFKVVLVYVADLWTAGILLIFDSWSSSIKPTIPFTYSKWIYVGCIFISFLLLALDWRKAKAIIASRDISYAFTSTITSRYYALKSYSHFCFFYRIKRQSKMVDKIAFFVFFAFKGWKRLIFAEAPRQAISAITLYPIIKTNITRDWMNLSAYGHSTVERLAMALMAFTFLSFAFSATKLIVAFILYIPLLFHIRGNLKEYCCHKIDKRIEGLLIKNSRKRRINQRKAAAKGDLRKKNKIKANNSRQPTLPNVENNTLTPPSNVHHNSRFAERFEPTAMAYRPPNQIPPYLNASPLPPRAIPQEFLFNSRFRSPESTQARFQPPPLTNHGIPPARYVPQNDYY
ncbi:unnamed protein product [Rhizophagus irregularis]|nr:unnamed protein product [Rhizophagus irregularis]